MCVCVLRAGVCVHEYVCACEWMRVRVFMHLRLYMCARVRFDFYNSHDGFAHKTKYNKDFHL